MVEKQKDKWINSAIKKPGVLRARAKREGALKKDGSIERSWLERVAKEKGVWGQRARLALTMRKWK